MAILTGRLNFARLYAIDPLTVASFGGTSPNANTMTLTGITQVSATYSDPNAQVYDENNSGTYNGPDTVTTTFPGGTAPTVLSRVNTSLFGTAGNDFGSGIEYALLQDADGNTYLLISDNFDEARLNSGTVTLQEEEGFENLPVAFIFCFGAGTAITTAEGPRGVEALQAGDLVRTADGRDVPIVWIGRTEITARDLDLNPMLRPITIAPGALGSGLPERALQVSRQHRMLLGAGEGPEYFVPAIKLTALPGVDLDAAAQSVTYYHLLTPSHEAILAEGARAETLFLGAFSWEALGAANRAELAALGFTPETQGPLARPELRGAAARDFVDRLFGVSVEAA